MGGFAWKEQSPAEPVPSSWLTEITGRAELLPELVPGELSQGRSRAVFLEQSCAHGAELYSWSRSVFMELNRPCLQAEV